MLYIFGHKAAFLLRMYNVEIGECVRLRASVSFNGMSCYIHTCVIIIVCALMLLYRDVETFGSNKKSVDNYFQITCL